MTAARPNPSRSHPPGTSGRAAGASRPRRSLPGQGIGTPCPGALSHQIGPRHRGKTFSAGCRSRASAPCRAGSRGALHGSARPGSRRGAGTRRTRRGARRWRGSAAPPRWCEASCRAAPAAAAAPPIAVSARAAMPDAVPRCPLRPVDRGRRSPSRTRRARHRARRGVVPRRTRRTGSRVRSVFRVQQAAPCP